MVTLNNKSELYDLIKMAVSEVFIEQSVSLYLNSVPYVSDEEMKEIDLLPLPNTADNINYTNISHWF